MEDTLSPLIQSVHDTPLQENNEAKGSCCSLAIEQQMSTLIQAAIFLFVLYICIYYLQIFYKIETALYNPTSTLNSLLYMFYNNYLIKKTSI